MSVLFCAAIECDGKVDIAKNEWGQTLHCKTWDGSAGMALTNKEWSK